jgi:hypothetical protein
MAELNVYYPIGWLVKSLFHLVLLTAGVISRLIL